MDWLLLCITVVGLIDCYSNHECLNTKSFRVNFVKANYLFKVACTTARQKQRRVKLERLTFKTLAYLVVVIQIYTLLSSSNQSNMQQASKIVENFPPSMAIYYSATTRSWSEEKLTIQRSITQRLVLLSTTDQYT